MLTHGLGHHDRHGVGLFTRGAAGDPDADHIAGGVLGHQFPEVLLQGIEGFLVPEERSHRDQHILDHLVRFFAVAAHQLGVVVETGALVQAHAPDQAAVDGGKLVMRQIKAGVALHARGDLGVAAGNFVLLHRQAHVGRGLGDTGEHFAHLAGGQHQIRAAGLDGGTRHAVVLGHLRVLHQHHAAGGLDRAHARGAVRTGTRQDDRHGIVAVVLGQRLEEQVHRRLGPHAGLRLVQPQHAVGVDHILIRRGHIDGVRLRDGAVLEVTHPKLGFRPQ